MITKDYRAIGLKRYYVYEGIDYSSFRNWVDSDSWGKTWHAQVKDNISSSCQYDLISFLPSSAFKNRKNKKAKVSSGQRLLPKVTTSKNQKLNKNYKTSSKTIKTPNSQGELFISFASRTPKPHPNFLKFQENCRGLDLPKPEKCEPLFESEINCLNSYYLVDPAKEALPDVGRTDRRPANIGRPGYFTWSTTCKHPKHPKVSYNPSLMRDYEKRTGKKSKAYVNALKKSSEYHR